jgi:tetratricopeptide (TPR) repeat protein
VQKGEYAQARVLAEKVIAEAARAGDLRAEATARLRLGDVHYYQGRPRDYRLESERALAGFERAGDDAGAALALYQLAYVYERTAPAEMLPVLERARARAEKAGDSTTLMKVHNAFGTAAWGLGRCALALDRYGEAAKLARRLGRENNLGVALANMGLVEQERANPEIALVHLTEALALAEKNGNRQVAANTLGNLATVHHSLGDLERATALHERALALHRDLGTPRGQATQLADLAGINRTLGDRVRAESQLREALKLAFELGDARQAVYLLKDLGSLLIDGGNADRAEAPLREAVSRAARHGDPLLEAEAILALADLYAAPEVNSVAAMKRGAPAPRATGPETQELRKQRMEPARGKLEAALVLADRAHALAARHHEPYGQGLAQARRGELLEAAERWPEAIRAYRKAVELHEARRVARHLHVWYGRLARLAARSGDDAAAVQAFEESLGRTGALDRLLVVDRYRLSLFREVADVYRGYAGCLCLAGGIRSR